MLADFIQNFANLIIALTVLRLLQAKLKDTVWGPPLAFLG